MREEKFMSEARELAVRAKTASRKLKALNTLTKNRVLSKLASLLHENETAIITENQKDMESGRAKGLSSALLDRLLLDPKRIKNMIQSVEEIKALPDPVGEVVRGVILPNGLELLTKRVPIGVVMTIFESRPNVIIDIASLSFKSGNSCILRGGSEAFHSNFILSKLFHEALKTESIDESAVVFVTNTEREAMLPFFQLDDLIDIVVPRGGEALIKFVSQNSKIPVVKHDKGVTNLYVSKSANKELILPILLNSKAQRPGVCNALENLILHKDYPGNVDLLGELNEAGIDLLLDEEALKIFPQGKLATEEDYQTEFLDLRLSVKMVSSLEEALHFIRTHSSGHTECILSEDETEIREFQLNLDSAAIFVNCSTRFHDGGEFGLGAEVGISTGKLHVRGPMGLVHLTTTTTYVTGNGQIRK
ncbi:glutamate-5-semialdehyde dehydrogenase [Leptospira ognonensis]|uniref:Gamma-glutamyl phosphate reductase n=1 Tax=Leptospira ognonensis TaxID=2484945 RepID=A0A4R9JWU2_9LEPT|nr:glutamate-5-semialdehyde dehydrogenase [Leptospira ognonensis]TGL57504.1 glutamate-5-semialdehyde dehydrogenase [Leptospira ognonensis]